MEWHVHGEEFIYRSDWVNLSLVDVERPDGSRVPHHVIRAAGPAAGTVVDRGDAVLLIHRHRFTTDTWGWEVPAGRVDAGETPMQAAARETLEETGWRPGPLTPLYRYHPTNGISDQTFHLFRATDATHVGEPTEQNEADRIEWVPWDEVRRLLSAGEILDGMAVTGLALVLAGLSETPAHA